MRVTDIASQNDGTKSESQSVPFQDGEFRNRYLAMLSHDLRSAISGVIGGLSGIDGEQLDQKSADHRESALAAAVDVSRLLDGILDMEAIEKNEFELDEVDTDLDAFLVSLQRRWLTRAQAKGLELTISKGIPLPQTITIDANRLARALGNILENAIKFSDHGEISVTVGQTNGNAIAFRIKDEGPGFSDEAMARLFEFKGRPDINDKPGTGLGLHIAKTLISHMGGDIRVKNLATAGAELKIVVPIEDPIQDTEVGASVSVHPATSLPNLSHLNILMAEDNLTNQLVSSQMLDAMGAKFQVASDGVEALALFEDGDFDLILMDIEMPRMSGLDVMRTIRSGQPPKSQVPIVALTAYAMREHRERISSCGADGLIAKPILGIEDFGAEILRHSGAGFKAKAESQSTNAGPTDDKATEFDRLIDQNIYGSLQKSLGPDVMQNLLIKVAEDLSKIKTEIGTAIETDDLALYRSASHVLISVAGAIGALSTQKLAEQLNKSAHAGKLSDIRLIATGCLTNIDRLLKFAFGNRNSNS